MRHATLCKTHRSIFAVPLLVLLCLSNLTAQVEQLSRYELVITGNEGEAFKRSFAGRRWIAD
ncbi:MAG: hypothetical protein UZ12_BCD005002295, partial [Bacteroidetes bacterium OLB12]